MSQYSLSLVHLYPKEMNIYGDTGNRLILQRRMEWRDIGVAVHMVGVGDSLPDDTDIVLGGGGQDAGQLKVQSDLEAKTRQLQAMTDDGVVMLMVCGLYQLFGRRFITSEGEDIKGAGILPLETIAQAERHIGNTLYDTAFGQIVGFENHSGLTDLDDPSAALGKVVKGTGNNGKDQTEGCIKNNVFGTYSHGPVLGKNPQFADELIRRALKRKYGDVQLQGLDDELERKAAEIAKKRPR